MKRERNHEGYHDPTACRAIRIAGKKRCRDSAAEHLTYHIGELESFQKVIGALNRG